MGVVPSRLDQRSFPGESCYIEAIPSAQHTSLDRVAVLPHYEHTSTSVMQSRRLRDAHGSDAHGSDAHGSDAHGSDAQGSDSGESLAYSELERMEEDEDYDGNVDTGMQRGLQIEVDRAMERSDVGSRPGTATKQVHVPVDATVGDVASFPPARSSPSSTSSTPSSSARSGGSPMSSPSSSSSSSSYHSSSPNSSTSSGDSPSRSEPTRATNGSNVPTQTTNRTEDLQATSPHARRVSNASSKSHPGSGPAGNEHQLALHHKALEKAANHVSAIAGPVSNTKLNKTAADNDHSKVQSRVRKRKVAAASGDHSSSTGAQDSSSTSRQKKSTSSHPTGVDWQSNETASNMLTTGVSSDHSALRGKESKLIVGTRNDRVDELGNPQNSRIEQLQAVRSETSPDGDSNTPVASFPRRHKGNPRAPSQSISHDISPTNRPLHSDDGPSIFHASQGLPNTHTDITYSQVNTTEDAGHDYNEDLADRTRPSRVAVKTGVSSPLPRQPDNLDPVQRPASTSMRVPSKDSETPSAETPSTQEMANKNDVPPKRKRGRPRKIPAPAAVTEDHEQSSRVIVGKSSGASAPTNQGVRTAGNSSVQANRIVDVEPGTKNNSASRPASRNQNVANRSEVQPPSAHDQSGTSENPQPREPAKKRGRTPKAKTLPAEHSAAKIDADPIKPKSNSGQANCTVNEDHEAKSIEKDATPSMSPPISTGPRLSKTGTGQKRKSGRPPKARDVSLASVEPTDGLLSTPSKGKNIPVVSSRSKSSAHETGAVPQENAARNPDSADENRDIPVVARLKADQGSVKPSTPERSKAKSRAKKMQTSEQQQTPVESSHREKSVANREPPVGDIDRPDNNSQDANIAFQSSRRHQADATSARRASLKNADSAHVADGLPPPKVRKVDDGDLSDARNKIGRDTNADISSKRPSRSGDAKNPDDITKLRNVPGLESERHAFSSDGSNPRHAEEVGGDGNDVGDNKEILVGRGQGFALGREQNVPVASIDTGESQGVDSSQIQNSMPSGDRHADQVALSTQEPAGTRWKTQGEVSRPVHAVMQICFESEAADAFAEFAGAFRKAQQDFNCRMESAYERAKAKAAVIFGSDFVQNIDVVERPSAHQGAGDGKQRSENGLNAASREDKNQSSDCRRFSDKHGSRHGLSGFVDDRDGLGADTKTNAGRTTLTETDSVQVGKKSRTSARTRDFGLVPTQESVERGEHSADGSVRVEKQDAVRDTPEKNDSKNTLAVERVPRAKIVSRLPSDSAQKSARLDPLSKQVMRHLADTEASGLPRSGCSVDELVKATGKGRRAISSRLKTLEEYGVVQELVKDSKREMALFVLADGTEKSS